ncbi:MAG TPA: response regulator [Verrucomicrobiae bacterium]|nr:response regulator [Verrucomicrobiae bacterium]
MSTKLRILLLEDNDTDVEVIRHQLKAGGFSFQLSRVQSEDELHREMEAAAPDLVLSDHGLPAFDGFKALEIVRARSPELPFIFVSGSNDQGMVARMYDAGATDYVFKNDIRDLPMAVREALKPPVAAEPEPQPDQSQSAAVALAFTRLRLCPSCLRALDETGTAVDFLEYFRSHREIVVLHELCAACHSVPQWGGTHRSESA